PRCKGDTNMRTLRSRALLLTTMALTITGLPGGTASAGGPEKGTHCTFAYYLVLSPGLSIQPSSGDLVTTQGRGPTGIDCDGPVNGHKPSGNGMMKVWGRYGTDHPESCASGLTGDGRSRAMSSIEVPTAGGLQKVMNRMSLSYGQPSSNGVVSGTFEGDHYSGTFGLWPVEGNCTTRPIPKV